MKRLLITGYRSNLWFPVYFSEDAPQVLSLTQVEAKVEEVSLIRDAGLFLKVCSNDGAQQLNRLAAPFLG